MQPRFEIPTGLRGLGTAAANPAVVQMVINAANEYGVPPALALGIASHESGFNPSATNLNTNGTTDWGVMQLNDTTVQTLGVQNPLDPQQNIDAGVSLLASYLQKYNGNTTDALWAYASGPGAVSSGNNMNSTAQGFVSYVQSYQPDPSLLLPASSDGSVASLTTSDLTTPDTSLAGAAASTDSTVSLAGFTLTQTELYVGAAVVLGVFWLAVH